MPDDFTRQGRASGWEKIDLRVSSEASFRKLDQKPCIYNTSKFHVWYNNFFTNTLQVTLFLKQSFVARSLTHRRQKLYGIANKLKLTKQPNFEIWWISLPKPLPIKYLFYHLRIHFRHPLSHAFIQLISKVKIINLFQSM